MEIDEDRRKHLVAKQLASIFNRKYDHGPCACVGVECGDTGCYHWWRLFLSTEPSDIAGMVKLHTVAKEIVKHGN